MSAPITKHSLRYDEVRQHLLARSEILLADVREEDPFAQGHPLWAANFPIARLELDAWRRIPQRDTLIVLYGHDGIRDLAPIAVEKLKSLGYTNVHILEGGLEAWKADGGELFIDVNVPSKSFGELVEAKRHTPLWDATKVKALLDEGANAVVFDARRFDEYQTMSIPKGINVPGGELVLRARDLAPDPETLVIVNCAGRTRSIIGTQSLINAGIPNKVVGLRNGTIGWTLAGQTLEQGASRSFADVEAEGPLGGAKIRCSRRRARGCSEHCSVGHRQPSNPGPNDLSDRRPHRTRIPRRPPAGLHARAGDSLYRRLITTRLSSSRSAGFPLAFSFSALALAAYSKVNRGEGRPQRACANCVLPSAVLRTIGPI